MAVELKALGEQLQEQLRGIVALQPPQPPQPPPEYPRDERLEWLERAITEDEPEVLQRHALIRALRACGERDDFNLRRPQQLNQGGPKGGRSGENEAAVLSEGRCNAPSCTQSDGSCP